MVEHGILEVIFGRLKQTPEERHLGRALSDGTGKIVSNIKSTRLIKYAVREGK